MKNKLHLLTLAFLGFVSTLSAQFTNTYRSPACRNSSGYTIEHFVDNFGNPGYIMATTNYANNIPGSNTLGVRVIATNVGGGVIFDNRYSALPNIHVLDICRDPGTNTYLFTGYVLVGGAYRAYIARINALGALIAARYYTPTAPYAAYHFQALSITPFNGNQFAIIGFGSPLQPTQANAPAQANQQMFLLRVNLGLIPLGPPAYFNHVVGTSTNNVEDVPIHITDVPGIGLHITGGCQSNIPGRAEGVLNIMFDYAGALMWEQSFMDLTSEDVEIGQFSYYDATTWGYLFILTYKYNSRTIGVYMVDPFTGTVISGEDFNDPTLQLNTIYGLTLTKDDVGMPDELFITGYLINSTGYPFSPTTRLPVFTTTINIVDLFSGTPNTTNFYMYDIPNDQYNFFNFTNHMLASPAGATVLRVPSHLGFSTQMAIMDGNNLVISSNRLSNMFGGWHPTLSLHTGYFTNACGSYSQLINYDLCSFSPIAPATIISNVNNSLALPAPLTANGPTVYPCSAPFFMVPDNQDQTIENLEQDHLTGTDDQPVMQYRFYPTLVNDAAATLYLELKDSKDHQIQISIYDLSGRMLQQLNGNTFAGENRIEIPATNLAPGMNIIYISGLERPVVEKVVRN